MRTFAKPRVVVSKCLGFAACRYNGVTIHEEFVERLKAHVEFMPVCPEMEIGLGCPRDPIRIVESGGRRRLVQPSTGRDVTAEMETFAQTFLDGVGEVDGFILKSRSPSCGIKDVKTFPKPDAKVPKELGCGMFGGPVVERFPNRAVEDEGRLTNFVLREHFLTRIFARADYREVRRAGTAAGLVDFHSRNKALLMAYHQTEMRAMGRLVANHAKRPWPEVMEEYGEHLGRAMAKPPRPTSIINVLMHLEGIVSEKLGAAEKALFLDTLDKYRTGRAPLSVLTMLVRSWGVRFGEEHLLGQTFLEAYPERLTDISDSGKGRDG
jgi:uncharacterized protein YbgA (DUF1722 family)/uncharacterized protein YbbK (DUF523 family)